MLSPPAHVFFAGAGAILVNPWNINDLSQAIEYALMMSDHGKHVLR